MLPKQSELELPLLKCLEEQGGQARPKEISKWLLVYFSGITEEDQVQTLPSGANKWRNSIAWTRQRLISLGQIAATSRGVWSITEEGRDRLAKPVVEGANREWRSMESLSKNVDALLPSSSRPLKAELRLRKKPAALPEEDFENKVWRLVHGLLPKAMTAGKDPEVRLISGSRFRPDILALFDDGRALLVECKLTEADAFLSRWLSKFKEERRSISETFKANNWRLIPLLAVADKRTLKSDIVKFAKDLRVRIIGQREIDCFQAIQSASGAGFGHLFWAEVAPEAVAHEDKTLPALHVRQGRNRDAYIFSANAHDILSRSIVSHRELHSPEEGIVGFQRMLQKKKLRGIEEYIRKYNSFPTPIIVAFRKPSSPTFEPLSKKLKSNEAMRGEIEFGQIHLPKSADSLQVIDGQHRLYGYSSLRRSEDHIVQVVAYKTIKDPSPADLFVSINSKQTKVPSKLLWELYPDIYGEEDPDFNKAAISRATESAAKRYLQGRFEHISLGMKGDITFSTLCSEVKRAQLYGSSPTGVVQEEDRLRTILEAFLDALIQLGNRFPVVNDAFVLTNIGITPMIRILGRILRYEVGRGRADLLLRKSALCETLQRYLEPAYRYYEQKGDAALRELRKQRIGGAGAVENDDEITEKIRAGYDAQFPFRPKRQVCSPTWEAAIDKFAATVDRINNEFSERGLVDRWVFAEFAADKFRSRLKKLIDDQDSFESVIKALYQTVIEGTGKNGTDNRLAKCLNLQSIYDIGPIHDLNLLRTYTQHYVTQIDPSKRQRTVEVLTKLVGRKVGGPSELTPQDYQPMADALLQQISDSVLIPLIDSLNRP